MGATNRYTVLIVEDDHANVYLYRSLLASTIQLKFPFVFHVEVVDRLSLAVARLGAANGIDLVILDLGLSDAVGFEGPDRIMAVCNVPIVIITGSIDQSNAARALERGVQCFYPKPLHATPEQFIHGIWSAIHRQKYTNSLKMPLLELEVKNSPSKFTVAAIIAAVSGLLAGLVELIKAWKSK